MIFKSVLLIPDHQTQYLKSKIINVPPFSERLKSNHLYSFYLSNL
jgi:hypothetical protein